MFDLRLFQLEPSWNNLTEILYDWILFHLSGNKHDGILI